MHGPCTLTPGGSCAAPVSRPLFCVCSACPSAFYLNRFTVYVLRRTRPHARGREHRTRCDVRPQGAYFLDATLAGGLPETSGKMLANFLSSQHTREARVFTRQILSPSGGRTQRAISACEHVPTTYTQACAPWIHTQIACFNSISQADLPKQSKSVNSPNQSTFLIHQSCMPNRDRAYECKT